jgi:hypothetical protein
VQMKQPAILLASVQQPSCAAALLHTALSTAFRRCVRYLGSARGHGAPQPAPQCRWRGCWGPLQARMSAQHLVMRLRYSLPAQQSAHHEDLHPW